MLQEPTQVCLSEYCPPGWWAVWNRKDASLRIHHVASRRDRYATFWIKSRAERYIMELDWTAAEAEEQQYIELYKAEKAQRMATVSTKYYGPSRFAGSKVIAYGYSSQGPRAARVAYDRQRSIDANHEAAARAFIAKYAPLAQLDDATNAVEEPGLPERLWRLRLAPEKNAES